MRRQRQIRCDGLLRSAEQSAESLTKTSGWRTDPRYKQIEGRAFAALERFFELSPNGTIIALSRLDTLRASEFRKKHGEPENPINVWPKDYFRQIDRDDLIEIIGSNEPDAWKLREQRIEPDSMYVSLTMIGLDTPEARGFRERHKEDNPESIASSMSGLNSDHAWKLRFEILKKYEREPVHDEHTVLLNPHILAALLK